MFLIIYFDREGQIYITLSDGIQNIYCTEGDTNLQE